MTISNPKSDGEWIEWGGGVCPVAKDTLVYWQLRFEDRDEADAWSAPAGELSWSHPAFEGLTDYDIIAYRVVRP